MKPLIIKGAGTSVITPMNEDFSINYPVFDSLLDMQIRENADVIIVAGTTGEGSTLSDEEHFNLVHHTVRYINGLIPVMAGVGSNKTSQQGLFLHFTECATPQNYQLYYIMSPLEFCHYERGN